jgi:hypothetical protein
MAIAGLLVGTVILSPSARANPVTLTYEYVYFAAGNHQRNPRTIIDSGFTPIMPPQSGGQLCCGLPFTPPFAPPSLPGNAGQSYNFAFTTVLGGSATSKGPIGGVTWSSGQSPRKVFVQQQPIIVLNVYVPVNSGTGIGSGATIDSFDETTGTLFNDTFVSVAPDDQQGTQTTSGNMWGYVDTTNSAEVITALSPTAPTGVDFSRWVLLVPSSATAANAALSVPQSVSLSALAFYRAPPPEQTQCAKEFAALQQVVDDCGPGLGSRYFGIKASLQKCVIDGYLQQNPVTTVENAYAHLGSDCHLQHH